MKKWSVKDIDKHVVSSLSLNCGISPFTASVLASQGYSLPESVMERLEIHELSDPFLIRDMQKAADIINQAIDEGTRICVYGDYDCDGITATAILYTYLCECGADVMYYIPERIEGYGLNNAAVDKIHERGVQLIITVDNGITAVETAEYIYSLGMKLIITDHHQQGDVIPKAEAVVDPHRHDDASTFKYLCGAGIALKLVAALDGGDYTMALEQFGDLAAVATVADIVSLTGENRYIVNYGLRLINNTDRPAIIALIQVSGLENKKIDSQSISFGIAPRINAAGRYGSPLTALKLLLCESYEDALDAAEELDRLNTLRKSAENSIISDIKSMIDDDPSIIRDRVICLFGKGWHHGVIGITASRIMERFGKPCFIASEDNGEIRGSARSFGNFSVFDSLTAASGVLEKFGGHPSAGGFTIKSGKTQEFRQLINDYARENHEVMPCPEITADMKLSPRDITVENIEGLQILEPFGCGNEQPVFCIENAEITDIAALSGGTHSKLRIKLDGSFFEALVFRRSPEELPVKSGDICSLMVSLGINVYRNRTSVSIIVSDIHRSGFEQDKYFAALNSFEAYSRGEKLPAAYYRAMLPDRDSAAEIYKLIPARGINTDVLYFRLNNPKINFCRFCVALEAMVQLGLIEISYTDSIVRRLKATHRTDFNSAPVLADIKSMSVS
ncbi:MAG: single-stranded-DNA-specific exonuclease RecJ [Ruminococcus sp.]|nr:single-stranded-DNA-specific exonuclease RecJ [Ruminococcus sp.]MDE6784161.1 single-stranded-DNA-specific exonuclease RecJ [Ruminococcus sp.]